MISVICANTCLLFMSGNATRVCFMVAVETTDIPVTFALTWLQRTGLKGVAINGWSKIFFDVSLLSCDYGFNFVTSELECVLALQNYNYRIIIKTFVSTPTDEITQLFLNCCARDWCN